MRNLYQSLDAVNAELQVIDVLEKGVEGRDQAIGYLKMGLDVFSLALAEDTENLPSEYHGI
jgi:hypothetical protein